MSSMAHISDGRDARDARTGVSRRAVAIYALGILLLLGLVELQPRTGADAAVLVSPWSPAPAAAAIIAGADGDIVSATRWPFIIIAHPRSSQFATAAYARGAWFVFDAGVLAGCRLKSPQ